MTILAALPAFVRDDWVITQPFQQSAGVAMNLTGYTPGAELYLSFAVGDPLAFTVTGGDIVVDAPGGLATLTIPRTLTATLSAAVQDEGDTWYPTRVVWFLIDPAGRRQTRAIQPILVLSARSAAGVTLLSPPPIFTGPQGPPGATGAQGSPTTVNGKSGGSITLTAADVGAYTQAQVDAALFLASFNG